MTGLHGCRGKGGSCCSCSARGSRCCREVEWALVWVGGRAAAGGLDAAAVAVVACSICMVMRQVIFLPQLPAQTTLIYDTCPPVLGSPSLPTFFLFPFSWFILSVCGCFIQAGREREFIFYLPWERKDWHVVFHYPNVSFSFFHFFGSFVFVFVPCKQWKVFLLIVTKK